MNWFRSWKADPAVLPLADRHYNWQKPGTLQFCPPGRTVVLKTAACDAFWVSSWPLFSKHDWSGAWVCTAFRNEGPVLSSLLIREALAASVAVWGQAPALGMITFVNPAQVKRKRDPGRCFVRAGFKLVGETKRRGFLVFQCLPSGFPEPCAALKMQVGLFDKEV